MIGAAPRVLPALMAGLTAAVVAGACTLALHAQAPAPPQAVPPAVSPVKGVVPASQPAWSKGIQAINRDSYYHAIECGKQGGAQPSCVFYDADLCKNDDFVLALYTPYKQVAYEVWGAVSRKRAVPTPSYTEAQRTRVVVGVTPVRGAKNQIADVKVRRGGKAIDADTRTIDGTSGNFIFGFPAFAAGTSITIDMVGKARTISCQIDRASLARLR
jgi:hypothetical protein